MLIFQLVLFLIVIGEGLLIIALVREVDKLRLGSDNTSSSIFERSDLRGAKLPNVSVTPIGSKQDIPTSSHSSSVMLLLSSNCIVCSRIARELAKGDLFTKYQFEAYCLGESESCLKHLESLDGKIRMFSISQRNMNRLRPKILPSVLLLDDRRYVRDVIYPESAEELLKFLGQSLETRPESRLLSNEQSTASA